MRIPFIDLFQKRFPAVRPPSMSAAIDIENNNNYLSAPIPPKLSRYQLLTGIGSPKLFRENPAIGRPAANEGIYKRTVEEEAKIKFQYTFSNYVVNSGGILQIVVGAALTALGAANGPSAAVTIFGAVNTVIAGLLTYLKGQGLPTRLEQYLHLLRTLREHIEERERDFLDPDCPLDVDEEIRRIAKMYQEVRQTAEDNAPGTVLPPRGIITSLLKKPDIDRSEVLAPRGDKTIGSMLATGLQDLASFRHHADPAVEQAEKSAANMEADAEAKMEASREGVTSRAKNIGAELSHLGDVAKETLEKLSGDDSKEKVKSSDQDDR